MISKRNELVLKDKKEMDSRIFEAVIKVIEHYKLIAVFKSFNSEIDTQDIIEYCFENGIRVCLPKIKDKRMFFVEVFPETVYQSTSYGALEPIDDLEVMNIELAITPLLAYNLKGQRIGYGGGYYDRYFSKNEIFKLGIVYDFQKCELDIYHDYDVPLDLLITNKKVIKF